MIRYCYVSLTILWYVFCIYGGVSIGVWLGGMYG